MSEQNVRCIRCRGRKEIYKVGKNVYSYTNTGGVLVKCPMCVGKGTIPSLENAGTVTENKTDKSIEGLINGQQKRKYKKTQKHQQPT